MQKTVQSGRERAAVRGSIRKPKQVRRAFAVGISALILLTGCIAVPPPPGDSTPPDTTGPGEQVAPELQVFYDQSIDWAGCGGGNECAEVTAPIDWENPGLGTIDLAVVKVPATGQKTGSLFTNPGGPGGSGFDFVNDYGQLIFGNEMLRNYDIIGWDPRGVGRSAPVKCFADDDAKNFFMFELELESDIGDPDYFEKVEAVYADFFADCQRFTGPVLEHVDTVSTAHDLDLLRSLVGDSHLNYVGFSYGAYLGAIYAEQFTEKVGRVVLDGPVNPSSGLADVVIEQDQGFEEGYQQFLANCVSTSGCPFRGDVASATQQTIDLLASLEESPLRASDGRKLWGGSFTLSIAAALYSERDWPVLRTAISDVMQGNADLAYLLIDMYHGRNDDGTFESNMYESNTAINCLDYPVERDIDRWNQDYERLQEASPVFGAYGGYSELFCDLWPYDAKHERAPIVASGSAPIVVIGSTFDTATPYRWAENLAASLDNGVLLTRDGQGHTSYGQGNQCIDGAVDEFILTGVPPAARTVC